MVSKLLPKSPLFKLLSREEMEMVSSIAEKVNFEQGQEIFTQNEAANSMYFIQYGSVRIIHVTASGDELSVGVLGTGSGFGEMSFVDGSRRGANAVAMEHTEVIRIDYKRLQNLFEASPALASKFHQAVAQSLVSRLRLTSRDNDKSKARLQLPL